MSGLTGASGPGRQISLTSPDPSPDVQKLVVFSLEMGRDEITMRLLSAEARVNGCRSRTAR